MDRRPQRGLTYIELLVALAIVMVLASVAIPLTRWNEKRMREAELKVALEVIRQAIDKYHDYCEAGLIIQEDVEQSCYPLDLPDLVDGVEVGDPNSPESSVVQFLARIPRDPFYDGWDEDEAWGKRSYQDDFDSDSWGGENVYDVHSQSDLMALDGSYYRDW